MAELEKQKYTRFPKKAKQVKKKEEEENDEEKEEDEKEIDNDDLANGYDYLLSMPLWSLTLEKVEALKAEKKKKEVELENLAKITPKAMWITDLDAFLVSLFEHEEEEKCDAKFSNGKQAIKGKKKRAAPRKPRVKEIKDMDTDEDNIKKKAKPKEKKEQKEKKKKTEKDTEPKKKAPRKKASSEDDGTEKQVQKKGKRKKMDSDEEFDEATKSEKKAKVKETKNE